MRIIGRHYPLIGIVGLGGVLDDTRIPHGGHSEFTYALQHRVGDIVHLADTILLQRTVGHAVGVGICKKSGEKLIYYRFTVHCLQLIISGCPV